VLKYNKVWQSLKNIYHFFQALAANLYYGFPARRLTVIGITGTDGKTTTTSMIYHLLNQAGFKTAMITSVEARFGQSKMATGLHITSPDPFWLQKTLRSMVDQGITHLALEVTSHGLDQYRVWGVDFKIAVFTNVTQEHLDYHHTWDNYLNTKARLLKDVSLAILNRDDKSYKNLKLKAKNLNVKAISYSITDQRAEFTPKKIDLKSNLPGEYNLSNSLAALSAVNSLGVPLKQAKVYLSSFKLPKGRMEEIKTKLDFRIFVDFAHTPNGLKQALTSLKDLKGKTSRLMAVFGSAGLRDHNKRPVMGQVAGDLADVVILTAEDPRTEDVNQIISQINSGIKNKKTQVIIEPDRAKAIQKAINMAQKHDIVGIFGKGHERSMCFGKREIPWSDQSQVKKALAKRSKK